MEDAAPCDTAQKRERIWDGSESKQEIDRHTWEAGFECSSSSCWWDRKAHGSVSPFPDNPEWVPGIISGLSCLSHYSIFACLLFTPSIHPRHSSGSVLGAIEDRRKYKKRTLSPGSLESIFNGNTYCWWSATCICSFENNYHEVAY